MRPFFSLQQALACARYHLPMSDAVSHGKRRQGRHDRRRAETSRAAAAAAAAALPQQALPGAQDFCITKNHFNKKEKNGTEMTSEIIPKKI
jgi:hypothetical protein